MTSPDLCARARALVLISVTAALGAVAVGPTGIAHADAPKPASSKMLPDVSSGLVLHDRMMPLDSVDVRLAARPQASVAVAGAQRAAVAANGGGRALGVDVSSYQHPTGGPINWGAAAASGQSMVVVKATEAGYVNPWLGTDLAGAHAAGMTVGAYAFARPQYDPVAQADQFARAIGTLPSPSLPPVLDLEDSGGLSPGALVGWTHSFLDRLQGDTGRVPMIYTGPYFWGSALAGDTGFAQYPLWEASYTTAPAPQPVAGWGSNWSMWQFTDAASVPGIPGGVDQDFWSGNAGSVAAGRPAIDVKHDALGGDGGPLGSATSPELDVPGGRVRHYQHGDIYWTPTHGAFVMYGGILAQYLASGGPGGPLGMPVSDEHDTPAGGRMNEFMNGGLFWSPGTGAHLVYGAIYGKYVTSGGPAAFGLPTTDEQDAPGVSGGRMNAFGAAAQVYWTPRDGVHMVRGAILGEFARLGGSKVLGVPVTDEVTDAGAQRSDFAAGAGVYWTAQTGAHVVYGAIRAQFLAQGGAAALGFPTADEQDVPQVPGARVSPFTGAQVYWADATGAHVVRGAILKQYVSLGGAPVFGVPVSDEVTDTGGQRSDFANGGRIYWTPQTGAHEVYGAILGKYVATGGPGVYGFPVTGEQPVAGGRQNQFQRAVIAWVRTSGAVQVKML